MSKQSTDRAYATAREVFADIGVDTEAALARLDRVPISLNCWQGDDVRGFENPAADLTGGNPDHNNEIFLACVPSPVCDGQPVSVDLVLGQAPTTGNDVIRGTTGADTANARRPSERTSPATLSQLSSLRLAMMRSAPRAAKALTIS